MKSITAEEVLNAVVQFQQEIDDDNKRPQIIANCNFDLAKVSQVWAGYFNHHWTKSINDKLDDGYTIVRIQTELVEGLGHQTMIYMVKINS